jgi:DNA invertase Pin-like site-specific DNA recombinase
MKAALYIRVSTLYQIDKDSLPLQRSDLIKYCDFLNISDYEIFEDAGYSGKNTDRPQYQKMMQRIRSGEFTHLIVWKIDRISRNLLDFANMYEELKKYNVSFVSRNEQFDTSSAMGEAMLKIILVFAELERNMTSERVSAVMLDRAKKGLWNGANVPLGYRWSEKKKYPVPDLEESKTIQLIFDSYEESKSSIYVSRTLIQKGITTKRGGKWTSKTLSDIIRNPFYKGTLRYNYRESARGKKKDESEWIVLDNNHEAIISVEQWNRCNAIMDSNSENYKANEPGARVTKHINIFSGIITCGRCGKKFTAAGRDMRKNGWYVSRYGCPTRGKYMECDEKTTSDLKIAPFIFNYIRNIIRVLNSDQFYSLEQLEKELLSGSQFSKVSGIEKHGLQRLITLISMPASDVYHTAFVNKKKTNALDLKKLSEDKKRNEAALERLEDLYIFGDISKKNYLLKKKVIEDKLKEIRANFEAQAKASDDEALEDLLLLENTTSFFLRQNISGDKEIDYEKLSGLCGQKVLKDFLNQVIETITVKNGNIISIKFKNGMEHKILY